MLAQFGSSAKETLPEHSRPNHMLRTAAAGSATAPDFGFVLKAESMGSAWIRCLRVTLPDDDSPDCEQGTSGFVSESVVSSVY